MGYADSIDFWSKWASVPLDLAITLTLGHDPEDFGEWDSSDFILLKALAFDHATAGVVDFKAPNNSLKWRDDPTVYLGKFVIWAETNGYEIRGELKQITGQESSIQEKPLGTTERNTLLTIIAALCKEAKLDHTRHAKTAGFIQSTAAKMGLSIGESTIESHLKKIPNALAGRMK